MVKLDIVAGFLGAGKTTLIKKILSACPENREKIVLIENEFGKVSIDSEILRVEGFQIYELSHGCVCCTLKDDFIVTLKQILNQKPDRIIVEPSGIFVLSEIFDLFKDPVISAQCYINSITTVVDGTNYLNQINGFSGFLENQIINASTLALSKTQIIDTVEVEAIVKDLHKMNDTAEIISKNWDNLSRDEIMAFLDSNTKYALNNQLSLPSSHKHVHHSFETFGARITKDIEKSQLEKILEDFTKLGYGRILRGKGFVKTQNSCLEFSYVNGKYSVTRANSSMPGMISLIGTELKLEKLSTLFR